MFFIADLHIHSHYATAKSKYLCLETVYQWALIKGIDVVGTGDFTHPGWIKELEEKLEPVDNGFYKLKEPPAIDVLPGCKAQSREIMFCLSAEVNCEYEINGVSYKNHHLLYAPDIPIVHRINTTLAKYADLSKDGRPTLPMSAYQLFKIVSNISFKVYFIAAHVCTPWFSILGSKYGHGSLEECFKDMTKELFAVETSLSADPEMCNRYSGLDDLTLMSNSDAHSASNLGREVNLFDAELSYDGLFDAVKSKNGFLGTYEYYPQHGKYFNDGHRPCNISISSDIKYNNLCPGCGKLLTIGVARRVEQLADRSLPETKNKVQPFKYVLPLPEIFSEILGYSMESQKVNQTYAKAISFFGNEFDILQKVSLENLRSYDNKLSIAIDRLRKDEKHFIAGYDGVKGKISFFDKDELNSKGPDQMSLF